MGSLQVDLSVLETQVKINLNNAAASLESMQGRYAPMGLISVGLVLAYSELAKLYGHFDDSRERGRFEQYVLQANKLVAAYWETYRLVLVQGGDKPAVVREQPEEERPKHIIKSNGRGRRARRTSEQMTELNQLFAIGPKPGQSKADFTREIATALNTPEKGIVTAYHRYLHRRNDER